MAIAVLKLTGKRVLDVVDKIRIVISMMTGNAAYTTPVPTLLSLTTQTDELETRYQAAINGGKDKKLLVQLALRALKSSVVTLTGYVQSASEGDEEKILSAGFDVKRPRTPVGILSPPTGVRSAFGNHAGEIIVRFGGVKGKLVYKVQINDTPGDETKWVDYLYTGKNRFVAQGLITDKWYSFRIATLSAQGLGGWSDSTSQKAF